MNERTARLFNAPRLLAFVLSALALTLRAWMRLAHADLWAEDGAVFLQGVLDSGIRSLLDPYAGHYHTLQRFIMLLAYNLVPLRYLALAVCIVSIVIYSAIVSCFAGEAYSWLVPSNWFRIATVLLLCLLPGTNETVGNLTNLNWPLFFGVALIGLKNPERDLTWGDLFLGFIAISSIGTTVLLFPLFVWRLWRSASRLRQIPIAFLFAVMLVLSTGWLLLYCDTTYVTIPDQNLTVQSITLLRHNAQFFLLHPWLGDYLTIKISHSPEVVLWGLATIFAGFACHLGKSIWRTSRCQAMTIFCAPIIFWPALCWVARQGALEVFQAEGDVGFYQMRYSYPTAFAATLLWVGIMQTPTRSNRQRTLLCTVFMALALIHSFHRLPIEYYKPKSIRWSHSALRLGRSIKTGCPKEIHVPIHPPPWEFHYQSPIQGVCIPESLREVPPLRRRVAQKK